ncbi:MAG: tetratricopeptide repeat protein [Flavobacterium sp.]|nr:MAG: tetratricopeptide repeat protein [Flavobacterium sp.]
MTRVVVLLLLSFCVGCQNDPHSAAVQAIRRDIATAYIKSIPIQKRKVYNSRALNSVVTQKNDCETRDMLASIAGNSWYLQDLSSLRTATSKLRLLSVAVPDSVSLSKAWHFRGLLFRDSSPDSSFVCFQNAFTIDRKLDDKRGQSKNLLNLAALQLKYGDYPGCESKVRIVLSLLKDMDEQGYLYFRCYELLGLMYYELVEIPQSIAYFNIAMTTAKSDGFTDQNRTMAITYNNLGNCYYKLRRFRTAINYYEKGLRLSDAVRDMRLYAILLDNTGLAHYSNKNYENAHYFFLRSKYLNSKSGNVAAIVKTNLSLSQYYRINGDLTTAQRFIHSANDLANQYRLPRSQMQPLLYLANLYPQRASHIAHRYIHLRDSITLADRRIRNRFARREFNTDEMEEERGDAKLTAYIFGGSALVLIIGGFLIYRIMEQRSKQRKLIFEQRQKKASNDIYRKMDERRKAVRNAQKMEKSRIATELQESIVTKLREARKNLLVIETKSDPETLTGCLNYLDDIQDLEKELRLVAHDLVEDRFSEHDNFNVILRTMLDEEKSVNDAKVHINVSYEVDWSAIRGKLKVTMFRILQQTVRHALRFGKPKNVYVTLDIDENMLQATIHDDGSEISPQKRRTKAMMKEVSPGLDSVSGTLDILSQPGNGTTIIVNLPL